MVSIKNILQKGGSRFRVVLNKLGLGVSPHYGSDKKRNVVIVLASLVSLLIVISASFWGGSKVGTGPLNSKINDLEYDVDNKINEISTLSNSLEERNREIARQAEEISSSADNLSSYLSEVEFLKREINSLKDSESTLIDRFGSLKAESDRYKDDANSLKETLGNSVRAVCCSFSDVEGGVEKNWRIVSNSIKCESGDFKVNCGSGETEFTLDST